MLNDNDTAIRVRDLTKEYRRKPVLDRVNLHVASGSMYALAGPNGAGKTTTIKILVNLLQASSGICEVLGCDHAGQNRGISPFQSPRAPVCIVALSMSVRSRAVPGLSTIPKQNRSVSGRAARSATDPFMRH